MASKKPPKDKQKAASKPPMCSVCENRHWLREPHVFGKVKA